MENNKESFREFYEKNRIKLLFDFETPYQFIQRFNRGIEAYDENGNYIIREPNKDYNAWDPENEKPIPFHKVINFEKYLSRKAKKIYLNKVQNIVTDESWCTFLGFKFFYHLHKGKGYSKLQEFFIPFLVRLKKINIIELHEDHVIIQYISLKADLKLNPVQYYIEQLAKLMNHLVKKEIVIKATLGDVMIIPHYITEHNIRNVTFCLFVSTSLKDYWIEEFGSSYKKLNKQLGFDIFASEGQVLDFDWNLIENLK